MQRILDNYTIILQISHFTYGFAVFVYLQIVVLTARKHQSIPLIDANIRSIRFYWFTLKCRYLSEKRVIKDFAKCTNRDPSSIA